MGRAVEKHGLRGLMAKVSTKGMKALDRRSAGYRALVEWRVALFRDLGAGADGQGLSEQEKTLCELLLRSKLFLDHIDGWLMTQKSLVNRKERSLIPVIAQRNALVNSVAGLLDKLGLKKREPEMKSLKEYLQAREKEEELQAPDDDRSCKPSQEEANA